MEAKTRLSLYALTSPTEEFAELYAALDSHGPEAVKLAFPKCYKFLESENLV